MSHQPGDTTNTISKSLADNLLALWRQPLPPPVAHRARIGILDTLGVTLAGSVQAGSKILESVILPTTAPGPATVIGRDLRISALNAAHINGMSAHVLDFDDSNSQIHGHPSVAVLPALLAAAEESSASGEQVLRAYACGVETAARLGMGVGRHQYTHGWHPTTTIGIFGGVAAAALVQKLDQPQIATAFSIATSMASGIKSNFGTMTKPLIVGQAARNALLAVKLAKAGFTAGHRAFEHHHGYLNVFNRDEANYNVGRILDNWADPHSLIDMGIKQKRYPCCYACLPVLDGVELLIKQNDITADDIAGIALGVHGIRYPHINVPDPLDALGAKFSVHYCVARVLLAGRLRIEDFEGDVYKDARTRALMQRTQLYIYDRENTSGAEVRLQLKDGRVLDTYIELAQGASPTAPLPLELVQQKFTDTASRAISQAQAAALQDTIMNIDTLPDIRALTQLLAPQAESGAAA